MPWLPSWSHWIFFIVDSDPVVGEGQIGLGRNSWHVALHAAANGLFGFGSMGRGAMAAGTLFVVVQRRTFQVLMGIMTCQVRKSPPGPKKALALCKVDGLVPDAPGFVWIGHEPVFRGSMTGTAHLIQLTCRKSAGIGDQGLRLPPG